MQRSSLIVASKQACLQPAAYLLIDRPFIKARLYESSSAACHLVQITLALRCALINEGQIRGRKAPLFLITDITGYYLCFVIGSI